MTTCLPRHRYRVGNTPSFMKRFDNSIVVADVAKGNVTRQIEIPAQDEPGEMAKLINTALAAWYALTIGNPHTDLRHRTVCAKSIVKVICNRWFLFRPDSCHLYLYLILITLC